MRETQGGIAPRGGLRRLLVGTDLSSRADRALRRAALLAAGAEAELLLVHAIDDDQPRSLVEMARREALALLHDQVAGLGELQGLGAAALIEEGDPFEALLRVAEAREADLLVLGEHRRRLLRDIFAGTTIERVMRHGRRPVLMVNGPVSGPYRHVVATTDLSEQSAQALHRAARLGLLDAPELVLLHAFEPPGMGTLALADAPAAAIAAHEADAAREAAAALGRFAAGLGLARTPGQLAVPGRPATVIRDVAADRRPDLVVLGTAGAGFLRRAVLGSVAAEVLPVLRCDALAVPPDLPDQK